MTTSPIVQITYINILELVGFSLMIFTAAMIGSWLADYIKYRLMR